jgi:hypothetical protein
MPTSEAISRHPTGWAWAERGWLLVALYTALTVIALYPIFSVTVPPLVDYPNHLARMHILAHWDNVPELQRNYVTDWKLHPNMAMELTVPLLAKVMPIYMAGKLFIAATLLMLLGGTLALRKVLYGHVGLWPVLTFLLLYNYILFWGLLDYLFTAGLALFAFSGWIMLRDRGPLLRVAVFCAAAFMLFVSHLFGLFVYGLMVLGYEIWRTRGIRLLSRDMADAWLVSGVQFVVPALLFLRWAAENDTGDPSITAFGPLAERLVALISPAHIGMPWIDIPAMLFLAAVFVMLRSAKGVGFAAEMKLPILLLALVSLAMPHYLAGVWGTHFRIPTVIACVAIAGVRIAPAARRRATVIACAAMAVFCLRTAVIAYDWSDFERKFMEFRVASAVIEPGSSIFAIEDTEDLPPGKIPVYGMQFWNLAALAVIERSAFLPTLFTGHTGIRAAPGVQHLDTPVGVPLTRAILRQDMDPKTSRFPLGHHFSRYVWIYWTGWPAQYDYAVSIRFANPENPALELLQPVERGSYFDIYRVIAPASATR